MTSSPPPYPPPPPGPHGYGLSYAGPTPDDPRGPARRAGTTMIVLGVLTLALGALFAVLGAAVPWDELVASNPQLAAATQQNGWTPDFFRRAILVGGAVVAAIGLLYGGTGTLVRRGGIASAIVGLILTGLAGLYFLLTTASMAFGMAAAAPGAAAPGGAQLFGQLVGGLCFGLLPLTLLGLTAWWLIGAIRNADRVRVMREAGGQGTAYPPTGGHGPAYPPPPPD